MIEIKEVYIEEAMNVHSKILEFNDLEPKKEYFENRYKNWDKLILKKNKTKLVLYLEKI